MTKSNIFASGAHRRTFCMSIIVSVESAAVVYFRIVIVKLSIAATMDCGDRKQGHYQPKIDQNFTFHLLVREVTAD